MAQSRSFNPQKEGESVEHLYKTRNFRCFRCIAIPLLCAFVLLLILVNVDFQGDAYTTTTRFPITRPLSSSTPASTTATEPATNTNDFEKHPRQAGTLAPKSSKLMPFSSLYCYDVDYCNITCDGDVTNLATALIKQQKQCGSELNVFLRRCTFPSGQMKQNFLSGTFRLRSLIIDDCDLEEIEPGAFQKYAVQHLISLSIVNARLAELNSATFVGLDAITYFQLVNSRKLNIFSGRHFLTPMASTLQQAQLQQIGNVIPYNPTQWLSGGVAFGQLIYVNLSGNHFPNTLTAQTFAYLVQVRRLDLSNSNIQSIGAGTFDIIAPTLSHLDLSYNQLTVMDWDFLMLRDGAAEPLDVTINGNSWHCDCESNNALIVALQSSAVTSSAAMKCATPIEWHDIDMLNVRLFCDDGEMETETIIDSRTTEDLGETTPDPEDPPSTAENSDSGETTDESESAEQTTESSIEETETPEPEFSTNEIPCTSTIVTTKKPPQTTEVSTTTNLPHTTEVGTTTNPPHTTEVGTTQKPPDSVEIICTLNAEPPKFHSKKIRNYDALFLIQTITATSVRLYIREKPDVFLVYFTPIAPPSRSLLSAIPNAICWYRRVVTTTTVLIEDLLSNASYVFCLVLKMEKTTSPFNCRSHYLDSEVNDTSVTVWLHKSDILLFILLATLGLLVCLFVGSGLTFFFLRWRPSCLRGCKRLLRLSANSHMVYLLPKASDDEMAPTEVEAQAYADRVCKNPSGEENATDFWHRYLQLKMQRSISQPIDLLAPAGHAPAVPSTDASRSNSTRSTCPQLLDIQLIDGMVEETAEHDYQSVDYYETVI